MHASVGLQREPVVDLAIYQRHADVPPPRRFLNIVGDYVMEISRHTDYSYRKLLREAHLSHSVLQSIRKSLDETPDNPQRPYARSVFEIVRAINDRMRTYAPEQLWPVDEAMVAAGRADELAQFMPESPLVPFRPEVRTLDDSTERAGAAVALPFYSTYDIAQRGMREARDPFNAFAVTSNMGLITGKITGYDPQREGDWVLFVRPEATTGKEDWALIRIPSTDGSSELRAIKREFVKRTDKKLAWLIGVVRLTRPRQMERQNYVTDDAMLDPSRLSS